MKESTLPQWIVLSCVKIEPTGSRVICNPPPTDTDQDWLCLLPEAMDLNEFVDVLEEDGWKIDGLYPDSWFYSVREGEDNLLLTKDRSYFDKFMEATKLAKEQNLLDKDARIKLFNSILPKKKKVMKTKVGQFL